jgi:hypothetical protein
LAAIPVDGAEVAANTVDVRTGTALTTLATLSALLLFGACSGGDDDAADDTTASAASAAADSPASSTSADAASVSTAAATGSTTAATAPPTTLSELRLHADEMLAAVDATDQETVEPLLEIQYTDEGADAAAAAIANGVTGDQLWAATWVYATSGIDPSVLVPVLSADDPSTRVLAAAGALALGEASAGPVLVDLVLDPTDLRDSEPAVTVGDFAAYTLGRFVAGPDLTAATTPDAVAGAWDQWWTEHEASLVFDPPTRMWSST